MKKKNRLTKLSNWYRNRKPMYTQSHQPMSMDVFEYLLTHKYITEISFKKNFGKKGNTSLVNCIQQLRNSGAEITSTKYRQGGKMHYALRNRHQLAKVLGVNIDTLKLALANAQISAQTLGSSTTIATQPVQYHKATKLKFQMVETDARDSNVEVPVYYFVDDMNKVVLDRALMCKEFNEKLDDLEQGFEDAWNDKQKDYADDNR